MIELSMKDFLVLVCSDVVMDEYDEEVEIFTTDSGMTAVNVKDLTFCTESIKSYPSAK